ncbi:MAG: UDP-N-acetylglucosamine--N-acetylmuramyl-(pentapeptide) pyrophosphoryl-undecaprenol N-acetylglucosamine transferase, partial [Ignavibacteriaceae bacterium]|nr:UDP-N-acetylglucosamine--N-acetylmuramyl-(pentapeptide) pyrophosphoryl-undecaprenol N-acetylglucosamine transferase [Ignavibacteriaceae bacterium]
YKNFASTNVFISAFIDDMNYAYSACDILVARAGATTIAELLLLGIPSILIPSPFVAENHQYHNAKSLIENDAAIMIDDKDVSTKLAEVVKSLINNKEKIKTLKINSINMAHPNASGTIAECAIKLAVNKNDR